MKHYLTFSEIISQIKKLNSAVVNLHGWKKISCLKEQSKLFFMTMVKKGKTEILEAKAAYCTELIMKARTDYTKND